MNAPAIASALIKVWRAVKARAHPYRECRTGCVSTNK
jgi:hypothetical protein